MNRAAKLWASTVASHFSRFRFYGSSEIINNGQLKINNCSIKKERNKKRETNEKPEIRFKAQECDATADAIKNYSW